MAGHPGRRLEPASKRLLEARFGFDFGQVRIHTDRVHAGLTAALNARAFTVGSDIVFAPGEFRAGSLVSLRLLAHELTHVIQQDSGFSPLSVQCAECDTRGMCNNLADSVELLNAEVNRRLAQARSSNPSPATVVTRAAWLLGQRAGGVWGYGNHLASIEEWANDQLDSNGGGYHALTTGLSGTKYAYAPGDLLYRYLAPAVNLNGFCVGTDKIGHMFQQGYQYFQVYQRFEARRPGSGLAAATAWGEWTEGHLSEATEHDAALRAWLNTIHAPRGMFGLSATGVHSRGDLAANRAGLQFYRDLLANPSMNFDIRRYVTADWDEEQVGNIYRHDIGEAVRRARRINPNDVILPSGSM
ncbi:MAG: hypothetical protein BWK76_07440 [Desulfobulbaceae bacterium A2]|nr:MAG: hypothetical protein BWK76_07440 [Desulfobulbaceae bacterium A2]